MPLRRSYRGRFAPTPSGDLHLGGARTALLAWLDARKVGGQLLVRVEDLDAPRTIVGAEARILDDLRWLGLDWDEGPDLGGTYEPYRQSERMARFAEVLSQLVHEGKAYPCFCSRREIAMAATAPHGPSDDGPRYLGTCRTLTRKQLVERARIRPPSIRLRVEPGSVEWTDRLFGDRSDDVASAVGDFVLRRGDNVPAYQLAVVVDDADMRISDVVRADDLLSSTARQILLYEALGLQPPRHAHVPLVNGPDGVRLSKRHGAIGIRALRERGVESRELVGALAATLGLVEPGTRITAPELLPHFDLDKLPRGATRLDVDTLRSLG
ncbi:MAG: tRNA glutamyl-Q(34) synthetase GluQRS [Polyangia bacterium]